MSFEFTKGKSGISLKKALEKKKSTGKKNKVLDESN